MQLYNTFIFFTVLILPCCQIHGIENGAVKERIIFEGPIFHFHDHWRKVLNILSLPTYTPTYGRLRLRLTCIGDTNILYIYYMPNIIIRYMFFYKSISGSREHLLVGVGFFSNRSLLI